MLPCLNRKIVFSIIGILFSTGGVLFILSGKSFHVRFRVNESLLLQHHQLQLQLGATFKLHNATYSRGKRRFPSRFIYNKVNRKLERAALLILQGRISQRFKTKFGMNKTWPAPSLLYNRVNKCGSSTMLSLLEKLGFKNNFLLVRGGLPKLRSLKEMDKKVMAKFFCQNRMIFSRHLYFVDWTKYGCDISYFNLIRDPVERFISRYYFHRKNFAAYHKDEILEDSISSQLGRSVDDCVYGNYSECLYQGTMAPGDYADYRVDSLKTMKLSTFAENYSFRMDSQIPFFCGDSLDCRTLGSKHALETAMRNIQEKFLTVGVLEQLSKSLSVLECVAPSFLQGLQSAQESRHYHANKNTKKDVVSQEAKMILRSRLKNEYELYHFVLKRLHLQYDQCRQLSANDN